MDQSLKNRLKKFSGREREAILKDARNLTMGVYTTLDGDAATGTHWWDHVFEDSLRNVIGLYEDSADYESTISYELEPENLQSL